LNKFLVIVIEFKNIFKKPLYLVTTGIAAVIYYFILMEILKMDSLGGVVILKVPEYLIYVLVITSGMLLSIGIYGIRKRRALKSATGDTFVSIAIPSISGLVASCGCSAPLLSSLLIPILGSIGAEGLIVSLSLYDIYIFLLFILINIALMFYELYKLDFSKPKSGKLNNINKVN